MEAHRFFNPRDTIDIHRRNLPHWQQADVPIFVTWRLADSIPEPLLRPWSAQRDAWLAAHPRPWSAEHETEYARRFTAEIQRWLDAGHGSCVLRDPTTRTELIAVLHAGDPGKVTLLDYVIMPNHAHVLFAPRAGVELPAIIKIWKGVSARRINQRLGATGTLWHPEYWDRLIRDDTHLHRVRAYIVENPAKAGLTAESFTLWSAENGHSCPFRAT